MSFPEQAPLHTPETPGNDPFTSLTDTAMDFGDFDINAAFQEAMFGVATDAELALDEKVRRMELIVDQGTSDLYREFIDFRQLAAQVELACSHDHALGQSLQASGLLAGLMGAQEQGHDHGGLPGLGSHDGHEHDDETPAAGKKKKKRRSWFGAELSR